MKLLISLSLIMFVTGCATTLLPQNERVYKTVVETKINKNEAYDKTLSYLAKNLGDSHASIKVKNRDSAQIVTHTNTTCNVLRQAGDINNYFAAYTLDFRAKDKKAQFLFEDVKIVGTSGLDVGWAYNQITSEANLKSVKPCLNRVVQQITKSYTDVNDF